MNSYQSAVFALFLAAVAQSSAAWLFAELFLASASNRARRLAWLAVAIGAALLALQHGYTLELALRTGLFDLRQAVLAAAVAVLFALGAFGRRRQQT